jgi:hypothetical protein
MFWHTINKFSLQILFKAVFAPINISEICSRWRRNACYVFMRIVHTVSLSFLLLPLWNIGYLWNAFFLFSFLILRESVGLLGLGISSLQGRYLHRTAQTQNKRRQTSMPWVGFEPTIPVFQRAKTFHASDRAATVIGQRPLFMSDFNRKFSKTPQHQIHDLFCSSRKHEDTQTDMAKLVEAFLSPFFANA